MKDLAINGSPRKNGNTTALLKQAMTAQRAKAPKLAGLTSVL